MMSRNLLLRLPLFQAGRSSITIALIPSFLSSSLKALRRSSSEWGKPGPRRKKDRHPFSLGRDLCFFSAASLRNWSQISSNESKQPRRLVLEKLIREYKYWDTSV